MDPNFYEAINYASQPHSVRGIEEMTIYDMLRHIAEKTPWDGMDFNEENARKSAAVKLINRLEATNLLGNIAVNIKEEM